VRREAERDRAALSLRLATGCSADARHPLLDAAQTAGPFPDRDDEVWSRALLDHSAQLISLAWAERLDLLAFRRAIESRSEEAARAALERFGKIAVGPFVSREADEGLYVGVELSVELPVFDRGQASLSHASASREVLQAELEARLEESRADILRAVGDIRAHLKTLDLYSREILPEVREALSRAEAAHRKGLRDRLYLLSFRDRLLEVERILVESRMRVQLAWLRLEAACGRCLSQKSRLDPGQDPADPPGSGGT
jgi:cobalt-zinc-cadmium efflux system outer membrane protein